MTTQREAEMERQLSHIVKECEASSTQSKRIQRIKARAEAAINGSDPDFKSVGDRRDDKIAHIGQLNMMNAQLQSTIAALELEVMSLRSVMSEKFAEALIAELAKQNEPVAFTNSAQLGYVTSGQHQDIPLAMWSRNTSYSGADIPLYTLPPTAEQIANETADAIARMLENGSFLTPESRVALAANGAAKALRNGVWKEFKK